MDDFDVDAPAATAADEAAGESDRYAHLAQRAEAFLRERGGSAPEDVLIAYVFGAAGSPELWRPLLRSLLGGAERLLLRADGRWAVADARTEPGAPFLDEFVALDVETTGLRPSQQRMIEFAAIRFRGGVEVERLETLLDPERRLPKYIRDLTGLSDELLASAPPFAALADRIVDFVAADLLVGHNVGFDIGFVNAELRRLGRPTLINERLDTLGLAGRLMPEVRKPSLHAIARRLGIPLHGRRPHRAGPDAALAAEVVVRLAETARANGVGSVDGLRGLAAATPARPRPEVARGRAILDRSLLAHVPKAPGVYVMRDGFDRIVYVGKAKNLRDRVGSYFSQPLGYTRKMDGLLESLQRVEVEVVGSELEALLLEAQLIRRYQPRYNTALRSHEQYPFIRVDVANPWPRITLAKARRDDGARYFGPFRHAASARKTVDLLNRVVPLRTCSRSFKDARSYGSPCLELDLGRCLGPCVGKADRDRYAGLVRDVLTFLDGRDQALFALLWQSLEAAAESLDYERAARLRQELRHVQAVVGAQRRLRESTAAHSTLVVLPSSQAGSREVLLIARGRLWARFRVEEGANPADLARRCEVAWCRLLVSGPSPLDHDGVDDAHILQRWLSHHAGHPALLRIPAPPASVDWPAVAVEILRLTDDDLRFEARTSEGEATDDADPDPFESPSEPKPAFHGAIDERPG